MNGRLMVATCAVESSHFAASAASLSRCIAIESPRRSTLVCREEVLEQEVDDAGVEVLATEEGVAGGGLDLVEALADLEDRDVERAAAEVETAMVSLPPRPKPYASDAAVGSLMIRSTSSPASVPASFVAWRCESSK